jgi:hypothetical protein
VTVAETATVPSVVPPDVTATLPEIVPAGAEALTRVKIVVGATTPPDSGKVNELCHVAPPSSDTSTPVGGVMSISDVKFVPPTT